MPFIFECLQCHKEFPVPSGRTEAKFCTSDPCYKTFRKEHGTKATYDAKPIFIREDPPTTLTRKRKPKETKPEPLPLADQGIVEPAHIVEPETEQSDDTDVISFEDLSLSQLRELISTLLEQNEKLTLEVEQLHQQIIASEKTHPNLQKAVFRFIEELAALEVSDESLPLLPPTPSFPLLDQYNKLCVVCQKPVGTENKVFCSSECALKILKSPAVMMLENGTLITTPHNEGIKSLDQIKMRTEVSGNGS